MIHVPPHAGSYTGMPFDVQLQRHRDNGRVFAQHAHLLRLPTQSIRSPATGPRTPKVYRSKPMSSLAAHGGGSQQSTLTTPEHIDHTCGKKPKHYILYQFKLNSAGIKIESTKEKSA
jgi:hypothetical protein